MSFQENFVWGAAAASYQIEGAAYEDGKGLSVWDMLCRTPGTIRNGDTGDTACDHYHRYAEDIALMQEIGLRAYRLSVSWPRVLPAGTGTVNAAGLDFYDRLIDALLAANVTPYVTLFHWDYPYELYCRGGWLNPDSPDWFAEYTRVMVEKLSDRVGHWFTLNEPQCFIGLALQDGIHAPGDKLGLKEVLQAGHHALVGHGKAVQTIRASSSTESRVGYAPVGHACIPATEQAEDIHAARQAMFSVHPQLFFNNAWWMDPVFFGRYPEDGLALFGKAAPTVRDGEMQIIAQPLDFFGVNSYHGPIFRQGGAKQPERCAYPVGHARTAINWPITPEILYWGPKFFHERYKLPVLITENGMSGLDWVALDGEVHDPQRIDYLHRHLLALQQAAQEGIPIEGYFLWSIMDNFEWAEGYNERFGIIYVDYGTQKRILKDSAYWYQNVMASNGNSLTDFGGE